MSEGRHAPPGDRSFSTSLLTNLGGGIALIALTAAAFWGVGQLRSPEAGDPVISAPDSEDTTSSPEEQPSSPAAPATSEAPTVPQPPLPEGTDTPPSEETPTAPAGTFAPAEVSVQVLDAAGDGGGRARAAADRLEADGYDVVAVNRAIRQYDQSTIFFTEGHGAEAEQVAASYPELVIDEETPSNLSDSVDLHIVIGTDYPAP